MHLLRSLTVFLSMSVPFIASTSADANASGLGEPSDAGASTYARPLTPAAPHDIDSLLSVDLAQQYPLGQRARIHAVGGGVRGFGMLAEYSSAPDSIIVARQTTIPPPGQEPYTPIALARVFDPSGTLVAVEEFTDQEKSLEIRTLKIHSTSGRRPQAGSGIWRISFSGGRAGDVVEIRLPATETWGVRGEMTLGVTPGVLSRPAWLWIPPESLRFLLGVESGQTNSIRILDAKGVSNLSVLQDDPAGRKGRIVLDPAPAGQLIQISIPRDFTGALTIEGAPGLLCPSPEAALRLQGGTMVSHGVRVNGPLQARARDWMVRQHPNLNLDLSFSFLPKAPDGLANPRRHALLFSKYGAIGGLNNVLARQTENLRDPSKPYYGSDRPVFGARPDLPPSPENWWNYLPSQLASSFLPGSLASIVNFDSPLNPAYDNDQVALRSAMGSLAAITSIQGDDLLRESNLFNTRYPLVHAFFAYPGALAEPLESLRVRFKSDPELLEIWRQGVMAVGDKIADYQAYQSNQWAHMIQGHLIAYLATGEKRFLGYFERQARAYFGNTFGPASKFGLHPAGYYLEEFGPDGNYDKLNSYSVAVMYLNYRRLPESDAGLVRLIHDSIAKNLRFNSFFWMPQPDGNITGPNAFNCRTDAFLGWAGYPGTFIPKAIFPLAASRYALGRMPARGLGDAGIMPFTANTDEWALRVIDAGLKAGPAVNNGIGGWLSHLDDGYFHQPENVLPASLPCDESNGRWPLPGMIAWKEKGLYGVVFADVDGASGTLPGITGGGPTLLWTRATGTFLSAMHPRRPADSSKISQVDDLTFTCVYGKDKDGTFFHTGKERVRITADGDSRYTMRSRLASPMGAVLLWRYEITPEKTLVHVSLKPMPGQSYKEARLNLPLLLRLKDATARLAAPDSLRYETPSGGVTINWSSPAAEAKAELLNSSRGEIRRLILPLPADGSELTLSISADSLPTTAPSSAQL